VLLAAHHQDNADGNEENRQCDHPPRRCRRDPAVDDDGARAITHLVRIALLVWHPPAELILAGLAGVLTFRQRRVVRAPILGATLAVPSFAASSGAALNHDRMTVKAHAADVALLAHRPAAEGVGTFLTELHALIVCRVVRAPILGADEAVPSFTTSGCVGAVEELCWMEACVVVRSVLGAAAR
jgi:hypothetical protein